VPVRDVCCECGRDDIQWCRANRVGGRNCPPLGAKYRFAKSKDVYAILETEARLALIAVGCDLGLGVIHAEQPYRDSFALDVMEPVRPHVDSFVLDLLASRQFSRSDFFESHDGWCKLMPTITKPLAATARDWATLLAPIAEHVAGVFARAARATPKAENPSPEPAAERTDRPLRTPLTGRNHSRSALGRSGQALPRLARPASYLPPQCKQCGTNVPSRSRTYCDVCAASAVRAASAKSIEVAGRRRRAGVEDGRGSLSATAKKREAASARTAARRAWEANHESVPTPMVFRREIGPHLRTLPVACIVDATGLSVSAAQAIRRGKYVPHPRHWESLRHAVTTYASIRPDWETLDSSFFAARIKPFILQVSAARISRVTGLSASYARRVRYGHHIPHRQHWPALAREVSESRTPAK
jgi:hypothetical protein